MFPGLERWTRWCYSRPPVLIYDHSKKFESASGVQQGDPLGPLYFCCGLQSIIDRISALGPTYQKWSMDDGGIVGPPEMLSKAWNIIKEEGPRLGLHLNPAKCEWSWLDPSCELPSPIVNVPLVPTEKIQMLGVPLGSSAFAADFVQARLLQPCDSVMSKLADFEDTQAAMYLLRLSYGIVRANHFMRTTPLHQWANQASKFDARVRQTVTDILGCAFTQESYDQACVSTTVGGLGIRRVSEHAPGAFSASWHSSKSTAEEKWSPLPGCSEAPQSQKDSSAKIDHSIMDGLISRSDKRGAQRLRRLDCLHANSWLSALPSSSDGKETILGPRIYRTAVRRLLGLPVLSSPVPCPLCQQIMDVLGDHALCCKKTRDLVTRHNRVRNLVFSLADVGLLSPEMEKIGLLGPTDKSCRRPGDVSFKNWSFNRGLAIDVAVICPVAESNLSCDEPCEEYARKRKHKLYDPGFIGSDYDFVAMVFETSGAVNLEGLNIIKQLIRFGSKREGAQNSVFAGRTWARIACSIQYSVAQGILNRSYFVDSNVGLSLS